MFLPLAYREYLPKLNESPHLISSMIVVVWNMEEEWGLLELAERALKRAFPDLLA
jgi:hypothetical protein